MINNQWSAVDFFCDLATLGSASNRLAIHNIAYISLYPRILAVYVFGPAGDLVFAHLYQYLRVKLK